MEEKTITKEEFDEAVKRVAKNQLDDPKLKNADSGISLVIMSLTGIAFANDLRRELFGGSEE